MKSLECSEEHLFGILRSREVIDAESKEQLSRIEESRRRICGTKTAQGLWEEQLLVRAEFFEALYSRSKKE